MEAAGRSGFPTFTEAIEDMGGRIWTLTFQLNQGQGLCLIPLWDLVTQPKLGTSLGSRNLY